MYEYDSDFEDEVRRIARILWPSAQYSGSEIADGRERDGIFITEDMVHLIECTTSRRKDKAEEDIRKLVKLSQQTRNKYPTKGVRGWFITLHEPTAEQRKIAEKYKDFVVAVVFEQFKSKLIDAKSYLIDRLSHPFGSMYDPETGARSGKKLDQFKYIGLDILSQKGQTWSIDEIADELIKGRCFILLGDYGGGKSTTMREIFLNIMGRFNKKSTQKFPMMLNLREHHGQINPAEALERHARNVGYQSPNHLVRAWLSGYGILLLDGFDEIATAGWAGQVAKLRDIRYRSMEILREFIRKSPTDTGLIISGRAHFFDSRKELITALSINDRFTILNLNDFSEDQMKDYLRSKGLQAAIPAWLPSRPLLLGYLASKGLLQQVMSVEAGSSPAVGWNEMFNQLCKREAEIEAGIDGDTVRLIIERLATKARKSLDGLGPLQSNDIVQTFWKVCGYTPDDRGLVLLQRLPGLGSERQEDGSREFIDRDFVDAARAGEIVRFIESPFSYELENPEEWQTTMGYIGRELAAYSCHKKGFNDSKLTSTAKFAGLDKGHFALTTDIIQVMNELKYSYSGPNLSIKEILITDISLGNAGVDLSRIRFQNCLFRRLELLPDCPAEFFPEFSSCYISKLDGRMSKSDLPVGKFDTKCIIEEFTENTITNAAIQESQLRIGLKVLLILLKKLYLQPGSGRKESSLFRGIDPQYRSLVPEIIHLLRQEKLIVKATTGDETMWLPVRSESARVHKLISAPNESRDLLIQKAIEIGER